MAASVRRWCLLLILAACVNVMGYSPGYKYLDEHCGSSSILQFSKDMILEYSSYRSTVPADYRCQVSLQTRDESSRQVQVHFRYLDTLPSPGCTIVGLGVSEGSTSLTPKNGVCGTRKPAVNYRTKGDTVTIQLTNTGHDETYAEFELLLTSFYYADRNSSCWGEDFRCNNGICVSAQLTCNGFNDCGDDSDEIEGCSLAAGVIVGIVFGILFIVVIGTVFGVCVRRRRRTYLRVTEEAQDLVLDHLQTLTTRCEILEIEQELLKKTVDILEKRSEWQDNYIRRHNLLFFGIPRTVTETREQCEAKIYEVLRTTMRVTEEVCVESVHRLGNAIVVKFLSIRDKRVVLSHAKNLRGKPVQISEDFTQRVREIRKGLTELKNTYRAEGKSARLKYDKLYTEFDVFTFDLQTRTVKKVTQERGSSGHVQYLALNPKRLNRATVERLSTCSSESEG